LSVLNTDNKLLGIVEGTIGTKSNEVLVVRNTDKSIDNKERLIPYIKSEVVKEINLDNGYVLVDWPEDF
jgi:16S rRNA processing protein RimM